MRAAKELHFNKNMDALKKMQAGADKLATVVGVTLGPKVRMLPSQAAIAHWFTNVTMYCIQQKDGIQVMHTQLKRCSVTRIGCLHSSLWPAAMCHCRWRQNMSSSSAAAAHDAGAATDVTAAQ